MLHFFRKPYVYCVTFSLALTLLLTWSLLTIFIIPKEIEVPEEEFETIDLSQFTKPQESTTAGDPFFVVTIPPTIEPDEPDEPDDSHEPDDSREPTILPEETSPDIETSPGTDTDIDTGVNTDKETDTETETEAETETEGETFSPEDYPIITDNMYLDENIYINITTVRRFDSDFHVAEIKIRDPQYLKTALAKDTYGLNIKEKTSVQAQRVGAILAINGDFYGANEKGYVIRNGVILRKTLRPTDDKRRKYFEDLAILWDGSFFPFDEQTTSIDDLKAMGAVQVFGFGPTLLKNGQIMVDAKTEVGVSNPNGNPRTAICYMGECHYLFVVADGRSDRSKGPTLLELAKVLQELGAVTAYNLDGGGSATMYFNGKLVNNPCANWNVPQEREVSDIVYIGY